MAFNQRLADALENIKHLRLRLNETEEEQVHQPELRLCADLDVEVGPSVSLSVGALHGQQLRFITLTPTHARALAQMLLQLADAVDQCTSEVVS